MCHQTTGEHSGQNVRTTDGAPPAALLNAKREDRHTPGLILSRHRDVSTRTTKAFHTGTSTMTFRPVVSRFCFKRVGLVWHVLPIDSHMPRVGGNIIKRTLAQGSHPRRAKSEAFSTALNRHRSMSKVTYAHVESNNEPIWCSCRSYREMSLPKVLRFHEPE